MIAQFPDVEVQLSGEDGNGFMIISRVMVALKKAGIPQEEIDAYMEDAQSGDYDHLIQVTMSTVTVS